MALEISGPGIQEEARREAAHRLAEGKGTLPIEQRNENAEKLLVDQMTERARQGEHFASSLHPGYSGS